LAVFLKTYNSLQDLNLHNLTDFSRFENITNSLELDKELAFKIISYKKNADFNHDKVNDVTYLKNLKCRFSTDIFDSYVKCKGFWRGSIILTNRILG